MKLTRKQAKSLLAVTFPEYRGRKIKLEFAEDVHLYNTNWCGGSKNTYVALHVSGDSRQFSPPAPWNNEVEGTTKQLPEDVLVVRHCYFCGKDMGITIYANPQHAPKWLTAGGTN